MDRTGRSRDGEYALDLFSGRRGDLADGHNGSIGLERISFGSGKIGRGGMDDLLDVDIGKNDYDWLLTPPGTPLVPSLDTSKLQPPSATAPRRSPAIRSVSTARASRLSSSHSENGQLARPARSSSVTRPSISSTYSNYSSSNNRTSVLNTSSSSVTSIRPSTPGNRSTSLSNVRSSTVTSSVRSRPSTPTKIRATPSSAGDRTRPLNSSRPSTPTTRPQTFTNSNSNSNPSVVRSTSRPSTPTRHASAPAPVTTTGRSPSVGRVPTANGRNSGSPSRPSSPGPRPRAPVRPIDLQNFPNEVPPNLRTKLPERPLSAGRTRPGMALTVRANSNAEPAVSPRSNRRQSLPIVSRSKFPENSPKARSHSNGHVVTSPEIHKPASSEIGARRPSKPNTVTESSGFGRTISKKSLDVALRHMDIRQTTGGIRGASLFPHSIRPASSRGQPARTSEPVVPVTSDEVSMENGNCNSPVSISGNCNGTVSSNGEGIMVKSPEREYLVTRVSELDMYGSSRYEAMLLKEDSKNMNWLHSVEDKSDQSPVFDHRFEPLPEPFGLL